MKLYCDCGNRFEVEKGYVQRCPMCGRLANDKPTQVYLDKHQTGDGVTARPHSSSYDYACQGGGKVPIRSHRNL